MKCRIRGNALFGPSSGFRQERIDQTRGPFLVVRRKEVESAPELIPERDTVEDDPSHGFGALADMFLWRPWAFFQVRDNPKAEVAFPIVHLVDRL